MRFYFDSIPPIYFHCSKDLLEVSELDSDSQSDPYPLPWSSQVLNTAISEKLSLDIEHLVEVLNCLDFLDCLHTSTIWKQLFLSLPSKNMLKLIESLNTNVSNLLQLHIAQQVYNRIWPRNPKIIEFLNSNVSLEEIVTRVVEKRLQNQLADSITYALLHGQYAHIRRILSHPKILISPQSMLPSVYNQALNSAKSHSNMTSLERYCLNSQLIMLFQNIFKSSYQ